MERKNSFILCVTGVLVFASVVKAQIDTHPHGTPGVDYPNYFTIPETSFKCSEQKYNPGFYADLETKCQAFHFCYQDRMESFLCPTGTIFNQAVLTCDVWYKSNCTLAQMFYSVNSGPIMERAGKNLPMLLRLRNRSQSKSPVQTTTASVLDDKVSSSKNDNETPQQASSVSESTNLRAEAKDEQIDNSLKDFNDNDEQMLMDSHEDFDTKKDANEETESFTNEIDEEMDTDLVYDNVNDGYYKNYDQYDSEWQDAEPENQEFASFYGYREPQEYEADARTSQFTGYINNDESLEDSDFTTPDSKYPDFTKRSSQTGHSRIRRKPIYVLDDKARIEAEESSLDSEASTSGVREGKEINPTGSVEAETPRPTPFPRPTAIPHHLLDISTETPMTSEEFESAIMRELVIPGMTEDEEEAEGFTSSYTQSDQGYSQSEQAYNQFPDSQRDDDTIYIENDMESDRYVPYHSQYEDVVVIPDSGEEADSDTEDTFVVIPDEYDNVGEFEVPEYPEETEYRRDILADQSPATGYDAYDSYRYTSSMAYPQYYEQANYPEQTAHMHENYMPNERYPYASSYELQSRPINYESSNFDGEEVYAQTEFYPYEETRLGVTERPVALPVTEEDLDNFPHDFGEIDSEGDMIKVEDEPGQAEDVYYVLDLDEEQSNQGNETEVSKEDEKLPLEESLAEKPEQVNEDNPEVKQINSSRDESSMHNESLNSESERSVEFPKIDESAWSSNSPSATQNEHAEPDIKSNINPINALPDSNLKYASQTPSVHESLASSNTPFSSNMGGFDFSSDSRFLNNMGYSESIDFGPYGFGPNMGQQFSMMESIQNQAQSPFSQRISPAEQPKLSPLSAIQEKMRSMKQGKFGAFKKYMSSTGQ